MSAPSGICMLSMVASREAQRQDRDSLKTANLLEELAMGNGGRYSDRPPVPPPVELVSRNEPPSKMQPVRDAASPFETNGAPASISPTAGIVENPSGSRTGPQIRHRYHENPLSRMNVFDGPKHQTTERILNRLPPESEAGLLLANYFDLVHPIHPILHETTVFNQFKDLYSNYTTSDTEALASTLSLIYTILSIGAYYWNSGRTVGLDWSTQTALHMSRKLETAAIDALSAANFMSCPTLETMQACVLLPLIQHGSNDSDSFRNMGGAVTRMAQSKGLHRSGSPNVPEGNRILVETQRRLWWHLTSTEWHVA